MHFLSIYNSMFGVAPFLKKKMSSIRGQPFLMGDVRKGFLWKVEKFSMETVFCSAAQGALRIPSDVSKMFLEQISYGKNRSHHTSLYAEMRVQPFLLQNLYLE